jgi:UDP-2,4-diacetamido-2,4,6-trideoxy-beta-L-altropyranose hydrolase
MTRPRVVFRVDSSRRLGAGHVVRCIALARQLAERGARVQFVCRRLPGDARALVRSSGFRVFTLGAPTGGTPGQLHGLSRGCDAEQLSIAWPADAEETKQAIGQSPAEWLIVDHYGIDARWERSLRSHAKNILVIDDVADRKHTCDVLLDQNLLPAMQSRYSTLVPRNAKQLLGPRYALVRPEFRHARHEPKIRSGRLSRVLVFFGFSDPAGETLKALAGVRQLGRAAPKLDVVVGSGNPRRREILREIKRIPGARAHVNPANMAELVRRADLALCAGGSFTWERYCLGLPGLVVAAAENQLPIARTLAARGYQVFLGTRADTSPEVYADALGRLATHHGLLALMAAHAAQLVDGAGAARVTSALLGSRLWVRAATVADTRLVFGWRNAASTRKYFFDPRPLTYSAHREWFRRSIAMPDRKLLMGMQNRTPVGVLRYDLHGRHAKVSIFLDPARTGEGLGASLLASGREWLEQTHPEVDLLQAEIHVENRASRKGFASAGFRARFSTYTMQLKGRR